MSAPEPSSNSNPPRLSHLIIVCCHAIFSGQSIEKEESQDVFATKPDPYDPNQWFLSPFQRPQAATPASPAKPGEHLTFLSHSLTGLRLALEDPEALLVFSGGVTKRDVTAQSEAGSYLKASKLCCGMKTAHYDDHDRSVMAKEKADETWPSSIELETLISQKRLLLEEQATDTLQNILFALYVFYGHPSHVFNKSSHGISISTHKNLALHSFLKKITIVTHEFKHARVLNLHCLTALQLTPTLVSIELMGLDPEWSCEAEKEGTLNGERREGWNAWNADSWGFEQKLAGKRRSRGWTAWKDPWAKPSVSRGLERSSGVDDGVETSGHSDNVHLADLKKMCQIWNER